MEIAGRSRLEGWEGRLAAVLAGAVAQPYEIGRHDCFRMACQVLEALTGVERWSEFEGRYSTTRQARRLLARHGRSFEAAGDWFFGSVNVPPRYAQRGDIVAFADQRGEKHLGVCIGAESVVLGPQGLVRVPTLKSLCAWRI